MAVTDRDEVFDARMQSSGTTASSSAKTACLTSSRSTMASIAKPRPSGDRLDPAQDCRLGRVQEPLDAGQPLRNRRLVGIEQQDPMAVRGRNLGDAGAHRAGADNGNGRAFRE